MYSASFSGVSKNATEFQCLQTFLLQSKAFFEPRILSHTKLANGYIYTIVSNNRCLVCCWFFCCCCCCLFAFFKKKSNKIISQQLFLLGTRGIRSKLVSKILMHDYFLTSTANMNKSPFHLGTKIIFANRLHIWKLIFQCKNDFICVVLQHQTGESVRIFL